MIISEFDYNQLLVINIAGERSSNYDRRISIIEFEVKRKARMMGITNDVIIFEAIEKLIKKERKTVH